MHTDMFFPYERGLPNLSRPERVCAGVVKVIASTRVPGWDRVKVYGRGRHPSGELYLRTRDPLRT
jgi:hypothetical protein